ncbi:MAG TPA: membrane protein insertase YidC [Acidimicrobiales bacterium]|nr:membrane protein insertase YidC [Acidimicrobiales bacterium]
MTGVVVLASTLGQIFRPLYEALAWTLAFFYAVIPNYAVAIALLTVAVMVVTAPFTVKSTKSTIAMQRLAPELKKIQQKYKGDRVTLNEEMMKLYKEHNINPAGGCVPMLLQLPVFIVLYGVIRGLTNTVKKNGHIVASPNYISSHTRLVQNLKATPGHMKAFGLDLAQTLFSHHASWVGAIPYAAIVLVAIALQYLQMRQLNSRNPAMAQANPQMQMMQRYMPLVFAIIYLRIAAGVNIYFVVSSVCRIGIQEAIFRSGVLDKARVKREEVLPHGGGSGGRRKTFMERIADAQQRAIDQQRARQAGLQAGPTGAASGDGSSGSKATTETPRTDRAETGKPPAKPPGARGKAPPGRARPAGSSGNAKRPPGSGSGANGARTTPSASTNGSANGAAKVPPPDHPRSAKKRPRKAR